MPSTGAALRRFHDHLEQLFGPTDAATLITVLTSVDTTNLATKDDLARETALLRAEMVGMKHEVIAAFRGELNAAITAQTRPLLISLVATAVVFAGSLLGAAALS
jgi:hypothetical protein